MMPTRFKFRDESKSFSEVKYTWFFFILIPLLSAFLFINHAVSQDESKWDRFRIEAELSVSELYNDNIYLTRQGTQDDFITRLNPELELRVAPTKGSWVDLSYQGELNHYQKADNFRSDHHFGGINFGVESLRDSLFQLGIRFEEGAMPPHSENDESRNFGSNQIYSDLDWNITPITSLEVGYEHTVLNFDEERDQRSDYIRDNVGLNILYSRSPRLPLLLEYRFEKQANDQVQPESNELIQHAVLAGCRWQPERRLSGTFELGYLWSQFNQTDAFYGWIIDVDLLYRIAVFTDVVFSAERGIQASDFTARDTLDYYILNRFGLMLVNRRFDPLELSIEGAYENRDFRSITLRTTGRDDDSYRVSIQSDYQLKEWLMLSLDYSYRTNQSSVAALEYKENLFQFSVIFSL
jgi:opacity protein-like surface antigen